MNGTLGDLAIAVSASPALALVIKATAVVAVALGGAWLTGRARASVRHLILASAFVALLVLPLASSLLPSIGVPVAPAPQAAAPAAPRVEPSTPPSPIAPVVRDRASASASSELAVRWDLLVAGIWVVGALLFAIPFFAALWQLRQLRRSGLPWLEGDEFVAALATPAGIQRPIHLLLHEAITAPLTCGLCHPAIVLPADAPNWPEPELRRAIVHELEHVRRADWCVHLAARGTCALYWFHPLVWLAFRKLSLAAERACDDAVVTREESTQYARQLVSLAQRMATGPQPALSMAARSDLSARVAAILDVRQARGRAGVVWSAAAIAITAVCVMLVAPVKAVHTTAPAAVTAAPVSSAVVAAIEQRSVRTQGRLGRALLEAANEGDLESVRELLEAGADVNAHVDGDGSPLIAAARQGHMPIVQFLLERGADPNMPVRGDGNPLIMAAREGHVRIVEVLLDKGALIDQIVPGDENALIQASGHGAVDVVRLLLARGADPNARVWAVRGLPGGPEGEWRTPLSEAQRRGHREIMAMLQAAGANQ